MSDEDSFMYDDDEDYDFDYEDDEAAEDTEVAIENKYYTAKASKSSDPELAIQQLREVVQLESEKGEWGFKALKQITKIYLALKNFEKALETFDEVLTYVKSSVSRNHSEKSLNNMFEKFSALGGSKYLELVYQKALKVLKETKNEAKLKAVCTSNEDGSDSNKATQLMDIYGVELMMHLELKQYKEMEKVYMNCLKIKYAVPHPRLLGLIRECGGKMYMMKKNWEMALSDFFESFKSYDEAGMDNRIQVLKYLILVNMLSGSSISPFDSPETKPYENEPEIVVVAKLAAAYQSQNSKEFEKVLAASGKAILGDPFIQEYVIDIKNSMKSSMVVSIVKPFSRVKLEFLAELLNTDQESISELLALAIIEGKVNGKIDERQNIFVTTPMEKQSTQKYCGLENWANYIETRYF
ncbi:hypothetical protein BB558_003089 [Smittium angustum]|uniref:PCI domain-containing protein n=1 Tax=Smittium angustum TaxID=133377 RepID=A0A2U1J799_SMIAN|nr:hypothetical protein BB558_003089 [Smittium angustum]